MMMQSFRSYWHDHNAKPWQRGKVKLSRQPQFIADCVQVIRAESERKRGPRMLHSPPVLLVDGF